MQEVFEDVHCEATDFSSILSAAGNGKMCRKCYSAYDRYRSLHDNITEKLKMAITLATSITFNPCPSKRARIATSFEAPQSTSSVSPDVTVS